MYEIYPKFMEASKVKPTCDILSCPFKISSQLFCLNTDLHYFIIETKILLSFFSFKALLESPKYVQLTNVWTPEVRFGQFVKCQLLLFIELALHQILGDWFHYYVSKYFLLSFLPHMRLYEIEWKSRLYRIYVVIIARCQVQCRKYFPSFSYFATCFTSL